MGRDVRESPPLPTRKLLAPDDQAPVLEKLRKLETAAMFTPYWRRVGVPSMMLHFEMYDKTQSGALTRAKGTSGRWINGRPFYRRRDLIDPTGFMDRAPLPS